MLSQGPVLLRHQERLGQMSEHVEAGLLQLFSFCKEEVLTLQLIGCLFIEGNPPDLQNTFSLLLLQLFDRSLRLQLEEKFDLALGLGLEVLHFGGLVLLEREEDIVDIEQGKILPGTLLAEEGLARDEASGRLMLFAVGESDHVRLIKQVSQFALIQMNTKQTKEIRESKPYSKSTKEFEDFPESSRFTQIKAKFEQELAKIIEMRTVQTLARVSPRQTRFQTLENFKKLYKSLVAHLEMLRDELLNRKNLQDLYTATKAGRAFSDEGVKSTLGNNAPSQDEQSFINSKLLQEVKTIQANYREIFIEGSLKRLNTVCQCTDLPYDFNLDFDIGQWSQSLSDFIKKKQKNSFWCCFD